MEGKFQQILDHIWMVANAEATNESTFLQETTEGYVKTHLRLQPDGSVKVVLESVFPLFEESTTEIATRIKTAQKALLSE